VVIKGVNIRFGESGDSLVLRENRSKLTLSQISFSSTPQRQCMSELIVVQHRHLFLHRQHQSIFIHLEDITAAAITCVLFLPEANQVARRRPAEASGLRTILSSSVLRNRFFGCWRADCCTIVQDSERNPLRVKLTDLVC
jgi:hypothetical protein